MGSADPYGSPWADQCDNSVNPTANYYCDDRKSRYKKKMEEGLDKTKEVAKSGMKKAKLGASASFKWIKQKCNRNPSFK